jgi:thymidylate synthase
MTASMRSNDVCLGLSTDGHNFSTIQELIASELGIEPGWYYHIDGSLHIYKKDYEWAQKILNNRHRKVGEILEMPPMPPNSLQYIKIIGGLEEMIRDNNDCSLIHTVPDYWQKWLLVFACYKSLKENRLDEATAHNESIGQDHPFYIFMKRSIDRKLAKQTGEYE